MKLIDRYSGASIKVGVPFQAMFERYTVLEMVAGLRSGRAKVKNMGSGEERWVPLAIKYFYPRNRFRRVAIL